MDEKLNHSVELNEEYYEIRHKSGLRVLVFPKPNFSTSYAIIATKYGSVDTAFVSEGKTINIPAGTAHFLEHKLFEGRKAPAFERFAKTGASANAYTTFDKTAYLFSATENFYESLEILLDFVSEPYFTEENVAKEQGIIGQEIKMYDDDPDWQVYFSAVSAAYKEHPIKEDIAGTVASISEITPELLYSVYENYYSLSNMLLCVAGNIDKDKVMKAVDKTIRKTDRIKPERVLTDEPHEVASKTVRKELEVSKTLFSIGIKDNVGYMKGIAAVRRKIAVSIALELLVGDTSELYTELYSRGVINKNFGCEYLFNDGCALVIISGESDSCDEIYSRLFESAARLSEEEISDTDFNNYKNAYYGKYINVFDNSEGLANYALNCEFYGYDVYTVSQVIKEMKKSDITDILKNVIVEKNAVKALVVPRSGGESK